MEKTLIHTVGNETTEAYRTAIKTHQRILANGEICTNSLLEICKDLKEMRDRKLFAEFGYETFDEYVEKAVGIKSRQAYTYISTYERLGSTFLQSNASLGITKLDLIAQLNPQDRVEKMESGELADMSVQEMKALIKKCNEQGEQISMLTQQLTAAKENANELGGALEEIENLKEALAEKETQNEAARDEPNEADAKKQRAELEAQLRAQERDRMEKEMNAVINKLKKEAKEEAAKAAKEATRAAQEKILILEQSARQAQQHTEALQKELELSDGKSAEAKVYINAIQEDFNCLFAVITEMPDEQGNRFRGACLKLLQALREKCEE